MAKSKAKRFFISQGVGGYWVDLSKRQEVKDAKTTEDLENLQMFANLPHDHRIKNAARLAEQLGIESDEVEEEAPEDAA